MQRARHEFERARTLLATDNISETVFEERETALRVAEAVLGAAKARVATADSQIAASKAEARRIVAQIDDSTLFAPMAGRVLYRLAEPGEYAPVPGWDDRTPVEFMDQVFRLGDPAIAAKLTGIGPVFWQGVGRGSGALIGQDLVLTTGHLFAKDGKWKGGSNALPIPPHPSQGSICLDVCGRSYEFSKIELGSQSPRKNLGLDYAIARLDQPACPEAIALAPLVLTQDEIDGVMTEGPRVLNMGVYAFADVPRYVQHPLMTSKMSRVDGMERYHVFGVLCALTYVENTTSPLTNGPSGLYETEGCNGVPGGSGGPLLVSLDGGKIYQIIGVANSYIPDSEYNNYTQITGAFAAHLAKHVPGFDPQPAGAASAPITAPDTLPDRGPWLAMSERVLGHTTHSLPENMFVRPNATLLEDGS